MSTDASTASLNASSDSEGGHSPLQLLMGVGLRSLWRRLLSVRQQSPLLTLLVAGFLGGYLWMSFRLFGSALHFIHRFPGVGSLLTEPLMYLLFAFLFILLLLSNLVIGFTNLFKNREAAFLLTQPIRFEVLFQWKLLESSILASWAFLLLIAPMMAAFGHAKHAAWHFYPMSIGVIALFIVLPGVAGCFGAVLIARFMDRRGFQILCLLGLAALCVAGPLWYHSSPVSEDPGAGRMVALMERMLQRTGFAQFPLLPSYWLTSVVIQWAEGALAAAGFFMLVLLSNALFLGVVVPRQLGAFFYRAAAESHGRGGVFWQWRRARAMSEQAEPTLYPVSTAERLLAAIPGLDGDIRALILKDGRMFWRDTTQWAQTLMLFGLLAVYVFNIRYFSETLTNPFWIYMVAFLNLGACSLNLATLTTRFVFPQFSLEGKRIWIVGMTPSGLGRVVRIKYWVATSLSLALTMSLILLSCLFLGFDWRQTGFFCVATAVMTFTLNGMAVGLGTLYPNFQEDNPSKIVSGFGGTLCLVLSFLYILVSVVLLGMTVSWHASLTPSIQRVLGCVAGFLAVSWILGGIPLRLALKRVLTLEV
ncbi:MAG: hypothetical protein HYR88_00895 [Verrucomicrobia bacterium]|nr:hypothetical protein [Verrucomicrobiota bacterium]MBI3867794.1 hypothetical protein [Verrucomicrobiota bacterium]